MKGLFECEASERNVRRIKVKDIVKKVKDYLKTYSSAGLDISGGSHVINVPAFDKEDFMSWKVRFLVFLDGLEPYLLKTLDDGPVEDSNSDVEKDQRTCKVWAHLDEDWKKKTKF
ncbi:hypothetical protein Tco_1233517 [Tanacetum coccineum]